MIGLINGHRFGVATLNTSVQQEAHSGVTTIRSSISHIPASVGEWGPEHPSPASGDPPTRAESEPKWIAVRPPSSSPLSPQPDKTAFQISRDFRGGSAG